MPSAPEASDGAARPRPWPRRPDRRCRPGGPRARSGRRGAPEPAPAAAEDRRRDDRPAWPSRSGSRASSSRCSSGPRAAGGWELIAGERRWRAAREAGLKTVPAVVRHADDRDSLLLALVENVAREQLSPVEEARAYAVLLDEFALSLGEVADRVGRSKPSVANRLRLLDLPDDVLGMVERGELTEGHARAVLAVPGQDERRALASLIVRRGLSVRAAEQAARWAGARQRPRKKSAPVDPALAERVRQAARATRRPPREGRPRQGRDRLCRRARAGRDRRGSRARSHRADLLSIRSGRGCDRGSTHESKPSEDRMAEGSGRSWIRTTDLRLIRAAL